MVVYAPFAIIMACQMLSVRRFDVQHIFHVSTSSSNYSF